MPDGDHIYEIALHDVQDAVCADEHLSYLHADYVRFWRQRMPGRPLLERVDRSEQTLPPPFGSPWSILANVRVSFSNVTLCAP